MSRSGEISVSVVIRGLDAFIYGLYNDARFVVAGTPAGVTLAPEGDAHQSTITPSVGAELPGICYVEPCFATEVDWLLCNALARLSLREGESCYLLLSTRPADQTPFSIALERYGEDRLRSLVLAGGYRLQEPREAAAATDGRPGVTIVTTGALVPEAIAAANVLKMEGVAPSVVHLTSPDRVYRSWQGRHRRGAQTGRVVRELRHLHHLIPRSDRGNSIVNVHDASSHPLAWLGSAIGVPQVALGVDRFGESGTIGEL